MKITKKELFKFCDENNDAINELQSQSDSTDFLLAVLIQQLKDSGVIDELSPELKPQLKQLDQSVFDGLDEKWRFAAVDEDGSVAVYLARPICNYLQWYVEDKSLGLSYKYFSNKKGYDTSNWQNSLIERDTAKELLEVDLSSELTGSELCKAMIIGDRGWVLAYVSNENDATALFHKNAMVVTDFDLSEDAFYCRGENWAHAVPINNQGEPLTASEVGL